MDDAVAGLLFPGVQLHLLQGILGRIRIQQFWAYPGRFWVNMCAQSLSCVQIFVTPPHGPPGSLVHGMFQARVVEWVTTSFSRGSSWPRDRTWVSFLSCIGSGFPTTALPGKPSGSIYSMLFDAWSFKGMRNKIYFFILALSSLRHPLLLIY